MKQTPTNQAAQGWINTNKRSIVFGSLVLNGFFIVVTVAALVLTHTQNLRVAKMAHQTFERTCPDATASKLETKKSRDITTNTYYVDVKTLDSGCADTLMQTAEVDDFRAYPDHAKQSADSFRQLSPDKTLQVTTVKSLENGNQLAPFVIKK